MYSIRCIECSSFSYVVLNNRHLCGTCQEEWRKRLKSTHLGAEILKGGGAFEMKIILTIGGILSIA